MIPLLFKKKRVKPIYITLKLSTWLASLLFWIWTESKTVLYNPTEKINYQTFLLPELVPVFKLILPAEIESLKKINPILRGS